jgi:hypothetical protein
MTDGEARCHQVHKRFFSLILRHGSDEEKQQVHETLEVMRSARGAVVEGVWEPLDELTLPGFLVRKCDRVARERHQRARRFSLQNRHGIQRTLEEETRSVEGQYAACVMLDLSLGITDYREARASGNIGGGVSAFVPRPGNFSLFIDEAEPHQRKLFLILQDGEHTYRCGGWCRAGEFQQPEYQRAFVRNGVTSNPYVVPAEQLSQLREWFGMPRRDFSSWADYGLEPA